MIPQLRHGLGVPRGSKIYKVADGMANQCREEARHLFQPIHKHSLSANASPHRSREGSADFRLSGSLRLFTGTRTKPAEFENRKLCATCSKEAA